MNAPDVRPGQIWADNDNRVEGRHLLVVEVVREVDGDPVRNPYAVVRNVTGTRETRIRLDRFRPTNTGYRLMSEDGAE